MGKDSKVTHLLSVSRTYDLLLVQRKQQKLWDAFFRDYILKLYICLAERRTLLAGFEEAGRCVISSLSEEADGKGLRVASNRHLVRN